MIEHRRAFRRLAGPLAIALVAVVLTSCGSGRQPDTGGVDPGTYMARFSGQWAIDENVSEDPAPAVAALAEQLEGLEDSDQPRVGGRRGGAGRRGRRGRPRRSGPDPEALRATLDVFRAVPERFTLNVSDSTVVTTWVGEAEGRMEIAGNGISTTVSEQPTAASVEWDGGRLRIERRVEGARGATVVDLFEAFADRDRLLITRRLRGLGGPTSEPPTVRLAYDLVESP